MQDEYKLVCYFYDHYFLYCDFCFKKLLLLLLLLPTQPRTYRNQLFQHFTPAVVDDDDDGGGGGGGGYFNSPP